ncbi:MAG: glycosyl hydrolase, partial [Chitinophagaceae bacterium]|nr:glycosyl hydrolase [Chitinophagaceae bacterium]
MALILFKKNQFLFFISFLFTLSIQLASAQVLVSPTPATERLRSMEQRKELLKDSVLNSVSFRSIGPSIMSGRVVDVDANPEDPTEFYVAYATGGLWHTANNGQSFTPIMDSLAVHFIGDIAVNWKSSPRLIWVG